MTRPTLEKAKGVTKVNKLVFVHIKLSRSHQHLQLG
jgi:hypothetical protein